MLCTCQHWDLKIREIFRCPALGWSATLIAVHIPFTFRHGDRLNPKITTRQSPALKYQSFLLFVFVLHLLLIIILLDAV